MQWIIGPLKKYADFGGRASRMEFWIFLLFVTVLTVAAHYVDGPEGREHGFLEVKQSDFPSAVEPARSQRETLIVVTVFPSS